MTKNIELKDHKNLSENEIFDKIKEELSSIQDKLSEKSEEKMTINEAKDELKKINERLQWTKLEQKNKKEIWKAFDKLLTLEKNIDENNLQTEINEIVTLLETLTQKELNNLKFSIKWAENRPPEVQQWIKESSKNLTTTINNAAEDINPIANRVGNLMKKLNS